MTYTENYIIMKKNTFSFLMLQIWEIFYKARAFLWHFYHNKEFVDRCGFFSRMFCEKCNYNFATQTVCSWQPVKVSLNHTLHLSFVGRGESLHSISCELYVWVENTQPWHSSAWHTYSHSDSWSENTRPSVMSIRGYVSVRKSFLAQIIQKRSRCSLIHRYFHVYMITISNNLADISTAWQFWHICSAIACRQYKVHFV